MFTHRDVQCNMTAGSNGIAGGDFDIYGADRTIPRSMTAFTAIAWYNCLELLILIFVVFKRFSGLYFWSLLITTLGVVPYATGAWIKQNSVSHDSNLTDSLLTIGWVLMVPGQSMVLYSRLHLICQNDRLVRFILYLIIINAVVLCTPTITLNWGQYFRNPEPYTRGYAIMEKIQMSIFTLQETLISCVYFWEIRRLLKVIFDVPTRQIMWRLVAMNILLLVLDAALLSIEFLGLYMIQITFKSLVYSVKLKVEFGTLSQIVKVFQDRSQQNSLALAINTTMLGGDTDVEEARVSFKNEGVAGLQCNIPPEWRISIGSTEMASPNLLQIERARIGPSPTHSLTSVEKMYPGRLG
ncbi:integral membrane protein [Dendryphion nanum]|uniref:Integral membrane protein n=1 Tax=Dendryphion nanum TaxID=256645 RepID=A0A9P9IMB7_9PLEO|nr:integral membrane protein [Dendryphion nanum]